MDLNNETITHGQYPIEYENVRGYVKTPIFVSEKDESGVTIALIQYEINPETVEEAALPHLFVMDYFLDNPQEYFLLWDISDEDPIPVAWHIPGKTNKLVKLEFDMALQTESFVWWAYETYIPGANRVLAKYLKMQSTAPTP